MLFNTAAFGVFLVLVFSSSWLLKRMPKLRCWLLLLSSYYFYACWDRRFLLLIGGVTLLDYFAALALVKLRARRGRQVLVAITVGCNLGLLAFWKYTDFFLTSIAPLAIKLSLPPPERLGILLPVGISFFTFQGLSYVVDVHRGRYPAERSLVRFALYIAFFPQLVAGPIVRASDFLPHLDRPIPLSDERFGRALWLILGGLLKKVVLADYLAVNLVQRVFDLPTHFGSLEVAAAIYGYGLQIYGDFSGYSDIAIGVAILLGFNLPDNFNLPYRAHSLQEFWRRWHISLSTWLRDYLYITLGGSRGGKLATYRNLTITMVLGGLWHGPSYAFLLWGAAHGIGLAIERMLSRSSPSRPRTPSTDTIESTDTIDKPPSRALHVLRVLWTFHVVTALWVFFRAETFDGALAMFRQLGRFVPGTTNLSTPVLALLIAGFAAHYLPRDISRWAQRRFTAAPGWLQGVATIAILYVVQIIGGAHAAPFIYFQF